MEVLNELLDVLAWAMVDVDDGVSWVVELLV